MCAQPQYVQSFGPHGKPHKINVFHILPVKNDRFPVRCLFHSELLHNAVSDVINSRSFFFRKVFCQRLQSVNVSTLEHFHSVCSHWIICYLTVSHKLFQHILRISSASHHLKNRHNWVHSSSAPFFALEDVCFCTGIFIDLSIISRTPFISSLKAFTSSFKALKSICGIFTPSD